MQPPAINDQKENPLPKPHQGEIAHATSDTVNPKVLIEPLVIFCLFYVYVL